MIMRKLYFDHANSEGGTEGDKSKEPPKDGKTPDPKEGQDGQDKDKEETPGEDDPLWKDPVKVKKYITDLRKENASYRTKAKESQTKVGELSERFNTFESGMKKMLGISDDDKTPPEEKIKNLSQTVEGLQFESAVNEMFIEKGIQGGTKARKYLSFLLQEAAGELNDGEEVSDEKMDEIFAQVQGAYASKGNSTSVDGSGKPPANDSNTLTPEAFAKMSLAEKTTIFQKNRSQYDSLMKQVKEKRLL